MEFKVSNELVDYEEAVSFMELRVASLRAGKAKECVWMLQHPPLYTAGTSAKAGDLLDPRFPVYQTGRGGEYTYHGPGQLVAYVMLDLKKRQKEPDIKRYIWQLEEWIIQTLQYYDIKGERRDGRIGIWVKTPRGEAKIAAIGVRIRHWVTYHGISINLDPDLSHFEGIVPCGIKDFGVTSMASITEKKMVGLTDLQRVLRVVFQDIFPSEV
jgi:lipoyl(octanoyl) transferase